MDSNELYTRIKTILVEQFEVDESAISMEANLYEELDIDSIDAVDLLVQLKEMTGKKIAAFDPDSASQKEAFVQVVKSSG